MPSRSDGSPSDIGKQASSFADALGRYELPIETVDERFTSIEAEEMLMQERVLGIRGRIKKEMIDSAAAVLIAERWLQKNS
jgi:putative transcription antitermination factor YqgF